MNFYPTHQWILFNSIEGLSTGICGKKFAYMPTFMYESSWRNSPYIVVTKQITFRIMHETGNCQHPFFDRTLAFGVGSSTWLCATTSASYLRRDPTLTFTSPGIAILLGTLPCIAQSPLHLRAAAGVPTGFLGAASYCPHRVPRNTSPPILTEPTFLPGRSRLSTDPAGARSLPELGQSCGRVYQPGPLPYNENAWLPEAGAWREGGRAAPRHRSSRVKCSAAPEVTFSSCRRRLLAPSRGASCDVSPGVPSPGVPGPGPTHFHSARSPRRRRWTGAGTPPKSESDAVLSVPVPVPVPVPWRWGLRRRKQ